MLSVLDRYILRSLILNYAIGLAVMVSLYVVLDLFVNMDEFTEHGLPLRAILANIAGYYGPNLFLYFSQLSGVIMLLACVLTLSRTRRLNELTAVLSSGVSLYRVAAPIILFAVATTALLILDTEVFIPAVAHQLARRHDDVLGEETYVVSLMLDRGNALLSAGRFVPKTGRLHQLTVVQRDGAGRLTGVLEADRAEWEPIAGYPNGGRWRLERGLQMRQVSSDESAIGPTQHQERTIERFYDSDLTPRVIEMRQSEQWIRFLSLRQLRELETKRHADPALIKQTRHTRIAAPIVNMVLLLLGLPFFLDRSPTNVAGDAWRCLLTCGMCYMVAFVCERMLAESGSALPSWIPIIVFAPAAIVLLDRIRT